ncbi:hypothetical protein AXF42_Ash011574 [Apostasia shenzhenica]|uniref:Uncharacterized protein n=1 Tax=Apostasia shenzhenica TaxID=1088818 RepID=A0A2I0BAZ5_9ASPA|nr:hypothetical protein AXF42_Ash011574 [Apostasia shenzhenica]
MFYLQVRSLDSDSQHQMYQKRSQIAVVDFFWIGGQSLEIPRGENLCIDGSITGWSEAELACWEFNILRSLKYFEDVNNPLVMWDITALLLAFKKDAPTFVDNILVKWISTWFEQVDDPLEILLHDHKRLLMLNSRQIQLLNVICRRVVLSEVEVDFCTEEQLKYVRLNNNERKVESWMEFLIRSEQELQERLVAFTLHFVQKHPAHSRDILETSSNWLPVGVAQVEQWVSINHELVHSELRILGSEVAELKGRNDGIFEYVKEEICSFCSAPVPFESPQAARCEGIVNNDGSRERHKLTRCGVSMRLCPLTKPLWFCKCCQRRVANLPPRLFFTTADSPLNVTNYNSYSAFHAHPIPLCPFCGILLQRSMPDFLLSTSPV